MPQCPCCTYVLIAHRTPTGGAQRGGPLLRTKNFQNREGKNLPPSASISVTKERKKMLHVARLCGALRPTVPRTRRARRVVAPAAAQGPSLPSTSSRCVRCRDTHASASPPQKRGRRRFSSGQRTRPPSARSRCRAASAAVHTTSTALFPPLCAASSPPPAAAGRLFCKPPCLRFRVVECPAGARWMGGPPVGGLSFEKRGLRSREGSRQRRALHGCARAFAECTAYRYGLLHSQGQCFR